MYKGQAGNQLSSSILINNQYLLNCLVIDFDFDSDAVFQNCNYRYNWCNVIL